MKICFVLQCIMNQQNKDEDLLQEANSNLIKALNNDYSIPKNKLTFGDNSANQGSGKGKGGNKGANAVKSDDPNRFYY